MTKIITYTILFPMLAALLLPSCFQSGRKKLNRNVTFWQRDKIPYGTWVAYQELRYLFPEAYIEVNQASPLMSETGYDVPESEDSSDGPDNPDSQNSQDSQDNLDSQNSQDSRDSQDNLDGHQSQDAPKTHETPKTVYLYILQTLYPDSTEAFSILNKAYKGADVFISASYIGTPVLNALGLSQTFGYWFRESGDTTPIFLTDPATGASDPFYYPGFLEDNFFNKLDTTITAILGTNSQGKANFIRISFEGGGNVYLHLSPYAFSNFFLLHEQNKRYYERALSYLPETAGYVLWDDYFRKPSSRRDFSALGFLWSQPPFKWAMILIIVLCGLLFLIESRRRQRMIPAIQPLRNSSVDFVTTVGRLYFQQKDHKNLAQKMILHFMEYIRARYNISTSVPDSNFIERLSRKSGIPQEEWRDLMEYIREIEYEDSISEHVLMELSAKMERLKR